jgi:MOSC domain-containing protein YiiM
MRLTAAIDGLFIGRVAPLAGDSRSSAIVKSSAGGPCLLGAEGFAGDEQADRRVHGGVQKALHLYPAEHYARLAAAFPEARHMAPGGLGENLSTRGLTEGNVCIGDIFRINEARIQVSQPRTPCWKIDHVAGVEGVAALIVAERLNGWYFRVLAGGRIAASDTLALDSRPVGAVTLAAYLDVLRDPRPPLEQLRRVAAAPGLSPDKRQRLEERAEWLRNNGGSE